MAGPQKPYRLEDALSALAREAQAEELALADEELFSKLAQLSQRLHVDGMREDGSEDVTAKVAEYYRKLVEALLELRLSKVAEKVSSAGLAPLTGLEEEATVGGYLEMATAIAELVRSALVDGSPIALLAIRKRGIREMATLLMRQEVQPFQGVDLNRYGPFLPGDIVMLPRGSARALVSGGQAEEVTLLD